MEKTLLSICIPTYNRAQYLEKCLRAIICQEGFSEIEVVISDNCSTDDTEKVSKQFAENHNIVKTLNKFYNKKMAYDERYKLRTLRAEQS